MAIMKCKMCGGDMDISADKTFGTCEYCGCTMTLPKVSDEQRAAAFNRGNHFRRSGEFDKALAVYERIVAEDDTDAEAHWCCALCRFGIEYVEDPSTYEWLPTCHRASFTSFLEDVDYLAAVENSDGLTQRQYQRDAAKIAEVQRGILATSQNEEPFDVFLCYKETDESGQRTRDSLMAQDIYYQLTEQGRRVFFARITLEDKLGSAYEPYIFAALNSAKVMVVLGTKPEYFNAVWVKNEWSRFLSMMKKDRSKLLLPCYRDMDPYDLPEALSVLQSYDMSKIGFMQDLIRGVNRVLDAERPREAEKPAEPVVVSQVAAASAAPLLERVFLFLEDGKWQDANIYCEKVLDIDPKNAEAYLGKLMAELQVKTRRQLSDCELPFDDRDNYSKVLRFSDAALENELRGYITHINERNENARLEGIYNNAVSSMNAAKSEMEFKAAAEIFQSIPGFNDADALVEKCLEKAEDCRKDAVYSSAKSKMVGELTFGYEQAIKTFRMISGWKDADEQIFACQRKIEEIKAKEEADRLEAQRVAEERRIAEEKAAKKRKKVIAITAPIVAACIAFLIVLTKVIIPNNNYNAAVGLMNAGQYEEAIAAFEAMDGYKDSAAQIESCNTAIKDIAYNDAVALMDSGKYEEAIVAFEAMHGYKDSKEQIENCHTAIKDIAYNDAVALMDSGKYEEAMTAFAALDGYKDSKEQIENCHTAIKDIAAYNDAVALMDSGDIVGAYESLVALNGYKDSAAKASEIYDQYKKEKLKAASVGDTVLFGAYEQDDNTSDGKEYIEWRVLAKEDNKILLISEYALDCQPYNTKNTYLTVTWETCSLRKWMNDTFLNTAFSAEEQSIIQSTTVSADKNPKYSTTPGNATMDKVFLLSITEVEKYFASDSARQCKATEYAVANGGAWTGDNGNCWWWLRSPGYDQINAAAGVYHVGSVDYDGDDVSHAIVCVRPALWINLDSTPRN